ncbi:hypothetical protein [uncultured Jatrophihabitans sp.]|uniref:hypothetical protein n=1 Tax=uncultured Jatrophihabitans sp. TaxID=1610747 RepID=UPI0035CC2590
MATVRVGAGVAKGVPDGINGGDCAGRELGSERCGLDDVHALVAASTATRAAT